jgi:hypothetical protein
MSDMNELPGRTCPLRYRYGATAIARAPLQHAQVLYVVGGLYGNLQALDEIERMAAAEHQAVTVCFNGDFNWFNIDDAQFRQINERVLRHSAIVGNVEAELAGDDLGAGCGCAYPEGVTDAVVERSNRIFSRLRQTAGRHPDLLARLARLPMVARFEVGGLQVGVVHGDESSLAGWNFDAAALIDPALEARHLQSFEQARVDIFASTHTCLPMLKTFSSKSSALAVVNNGAAGMPNFQGKRMGLLTRIAQAPYLGQALYGTQLGSVHVQALPIAYHHEVWTQNFLRQWPEGSDAYVSYFDRIQHGPALHIEQAFQLAT